MKRKVIIDNRMREKEKNKLEELGYELSRSKEYKTNKHIFLHKRK